MKVLVTGGAGYIGSHAVRELLDAGHEVDVLDDLSAGHRYGGAGGGAPRRGRLADRAAPCDAALEGADAVIHFAGLLSVGESVREPGTYYRANVVKGLALLDAMARSGRRKFVFSSTCATYGMPVTRADGREPSAGSDQPYGATKLAFERVLARLRARRPAARGRPALLQRRRAATRTARSGEDHDPEEHLIPLAIDAALGRRPALTIFGDDYDTPDGTCIRDYIHVQDLARAHVLALGVLDKGEPFEAFNLGTGTGHSVREVIDAVARVSGRTVPSSVGPRRPGRSAAAGGRCRPVPVAPGLRAALRHHRTRSCETACKLARGPSRAATMPIRR